MTEPRHTLPLLDDMLQTLLLFEEGEHEFTAETDVQELRHLFFPVTRTCIYLNHASNGPLPRPVVRTMHEYVDDVSTFGGTHEPRWTEYERGAHRRLANLLHARPDQLAFTANTGDSLMMVAQGLHWQEGDVVINAEGEFPSNVYPWLNLQAQGVEVQTIPLREHRIVPEDIFERITERTKLVSLSLVAFTTGYRSDIARIARYCQERGIICGIDAMQALGVLDVNVQELGVSYLAAASHKWLLAPRIVGVLYISDSLLPQLHTARRGWFSVEAPMDFFNHQQELKAGAARFEYSTTNLASIVGFDTALGIFESIDGGMSTIEQRTLGLTDYAIAGLERLGYPVISPQGKGERSAIVCFEPHPERQDITVERLAEQLAERNIFIAARGPVARISPHFYNTIEDIDILLNVLEEMRKQDL